MTTPRTRSLVLGGGGAVGIGWQAGILLGLREAGIDLAAGSDILGTSAGAVVGALLATGREVTEALTSLAGLTRSMEPAALKSGNDRYLKLMQDTDLTEPSAALRTIGRAAQHATTLSETAYLSLFDALDTTWPTGFRCTAIDAEHGELTVFGPDSGIPLRAAVAASCALPMLFPPVTIGGRSYIDGGLVDHLNAPVAAGDVLIVLSCHPLDTPESPALRPLTPAEIRASAELARLRSSRTVLALEPDLHSLGATPATMMDAEVARQAVQLGMQQGRAAAESVRGTWGNG